MSPNSCGETRADSNPPPHDNTPYAPIDVPVRPTKKNTGVNGRTTKCNLLIASLNISGRGTLTSRSPDNKWHSLHQTIRDEKIGITALQESHLRDSDIDNLHRLYGRRIHILHSPDPHTRNARGVAIVLNREIVDTAGILTTEIIPGRALYLQMHWHGDKNLRILTVYAPNDHASNTTFWSEIKTGLLTHRLPHPDILMGDFNVVEESLDRRPTRTDPATNVTALKDLLSSLNLRDGWRTSEPTLSDFTYPRRGSLTCSRIDRIYASDDIIRSSLHWAIKDTAINTDHKMVTANISSRHAPYLGHGRWAMPAHLVNDSVFMTEAEKLGITALKDMISASTLPRRSDTYNPQVIFESFKATVKASAIRRLKSKIPKIDASIKKMEANLANLRLKASLTNDPELREEIGMLQDRLLPLLQKRSGDRNDKIAARYIGNAERISKYWSQINKDRKPRDIMYSMRIPGSVPPTYEYSSCKMANLAQRYHNDLQKQDIPPPASHRRSTEISQVLAHVDNKIPLSEEDDLSKSISKDEVDYGIRHAPPSKAPGLDGLPYEFWKKLRDISEARMRPNIPSCNCSQMLTIMYRDFEAFGPNTSSTFSDGWMCPIYKKGDRRDIANYRPITLLNSDYKIYTKILTLRLNKSLSNVIHPSQAAFLPGRHIEDQTRLCQVMVDYCEALEDNGAIIALDQEKAYDKIDHTYLWKTLIAFQVPSELISRIKNLYKRAKTSVIINGESSTYYYVTRGVRQGDPLSCILFLLAIEPLSCMLRQSTLLGFSIPGTSDRIIASLFADDTSTFLSASDSWTSLWTVLNLWCRASTAKFNNHKTEIIPIGSPDYRSSMIQHRSLSGLPTNDMIPLEIKITPDGEAIRILGAWIGNAPDQLTIWAPTIHKVDSFLQRWGRSHPSLMGKQNIVNIGPGGISQYLTKAQGMPKQIEDQLIKLIRDFIWDGNKHPPISMQTLYKPRSEGGIGLLDIKSRNDAIELTWIARYLDLSPNRPNWAYATDILIHKHVKASAGKIRDISKINAFLQSWEPSTSTKSLPKYISRMLRTAKKFNVSLEAIKLSPALKKKLPIWYHLGALPRSRRLENTTTGDCLRNTHAVRNTADLIPLISLHHSHVSTPLSSRNSHKCTCATCLKHRIDGCKCPARCYKLAYSLSCEIRPKWNIYSDPPSDGLSLSQSHIERNIASLTSDELVTFNPSVTSHDDLSETFRAFVDPAIRNFPPAIRPRIGITVRNERRTVYISSIKRNQKSPPLDPLQRPIVACSYCPDDPSLNRYVVDPKLTTYKDELAYLSLAALAASRLVPGDAPLTFVCSKPYLAHALCSQLPKWEDVGWIGVSIGPIMRALVNSLRQRHAPTHIKSANTNLERRHITSSWNILTINSQICQPNLIGLYRNPAFDLSGSRLSSLTQRLATSGIRLRQPDIDRYSTNKNINLIMTESINFLNYHISEAEIWNNLFHTDFRCNIQTFLWKLIHNAFKCGNFWNNIPGLEDRAICTACNAPETMDHILTKCNSPGRSQIWSLAQKIWERKNLTWHTPTLASILLCGSKRWTLPSSKKQANGATRFWRILISESAFLIWKLRCERVIQHDQEPRWSHQSDAITRRWHKTLEYRMHIDKTRCLSSMGNLALKKTTVLSTWHRIIHDEIGLNVDQDWTNLPRVLVGISRISIAHDPG